MGLLRSPGIGHILLSIIMLQKGCIVIFGEALLKQQVELNSVNHNCRMTARWTSSDLLSIRCEG